MDKAFTLGLMEENTKEPMKTIKSMDLEFIHGKMAGSMKAIGKMANSTGMDSLYRERREGREFGRMEKGLNGY